MKSNKLLLLLVVAGFFAILSSTMSKAPTLPLYAKSLGLNSVEIGLVASSSTIVGIFMNFIAGTLSDIYGRKIMLVISGIVFFTAPLLYFLATSALLLALVRAYYGLATAIFVPVSFALVSDLYPSKKGTFMSILSSATLVGRSLAPTLAGVLIFMSGFPIAFLACSTSGFIALSLFIFIPRSSRRTRKTESTKKLFDIRLLPVGLIDFSVFMAYQGIETFLPLFPIIKGSSWIAGLLLTTEIVIMAAFKPFAGYLSDKIGRIKPIILGIISIFIAMILISSTNNMTSILSSIILFALSASLVTASTKPLATDIAKYSGSALGLLESIKDIGQALGPILIGLVGISFGYYIIGIVNLLMLFIFFLSLKL